MRLQDQLQRTHATKGILSTIPHRVRIEFLCRCADILLAMESKILKSNAKDLELARNLNLSTSMLERLELNPKKLENMAESLRQIAEFPDPLNKILSGFSNYCGLKIEKVSVPLGVVAVIYESRPNVTSDVVALCFKSGNACVLKGGKEAQNSNEAIMEVFYEALNAFNLPKDSMVLLPAMKDREELKEILGAKGLIDLVIPRGGEGLINFVSENAKIPVIKQDKGVCHIFAHHTCKVESAISVIVNAKTSRPSVCNACETLLVDSVFAREFLPLVAKALCEKGTLLKGCAKSCVLLAESGIACVEIPFSEYHREYGENILNLRVVEGLQGALEHISIFSSGHSEAILSEDYSVIEEFLNAVDCACVYANASTRFSDGGEFGYGAEVGISTAKIHARGPMGVESLTSYKYKIRGDYQTR
ncbi:glutamate-5-semialdehyde dehydrogenase [Helicobacter turcicus]|uniref:Gamma-glutamyl phosphate reductase n=1 Tax=Helicobacter turcicus TaxID=2867412 RepID=A0ABS7JNY0_9HELI|nr:glutamate-5-semialdehyde dehydrogenase [Helicobacter turcicus]MBX7491070.1 glutamate-5-semialdehyde dehydrogenase [Helicobacter turcicus]MBX7545934.1 glutamate-5-semialdehyde dehydrogenase [Helicobacter turcicus]